MPKYTQPGKTWQYSNEVKVKAVQLSLIDGILILPIFCIGVDGGSIGWQRIVAADA